MNRSRHDDGIVKGTGRANVGISTPQTRKNETSNLIYSREARAIGCRVQGYLLCSISYDDMD
jgi:hypothetical protein